MHATQKPERTSNDVSLISTIAAGFGLALIFGHVAVKRIAIPGALLQIVVATWWGWATGASLVFGLALPVASMVVLPRALESRSVLASVNGQIAVGWLIVEDLVMVRVLKLLSIEGRNLILAGALISIALNTLLVSAIDPLQDWLRKR